MMDWSLILIAAVKITVVTAVVLGLATLLTWVERKESAVIQDRIGANRADIFGLRIFGLFQPLADAVKMITKEDFVPPFASRKLHLLAPAIAFIPVMMGFAVIPFGPPVNIGGRTVTMQIANVNIGLLSLIHI